MPGIGLRAHIRLGRQRRRVGQRHVVLGRHVDAHHVDQAAQQRHGSDLAADGVRIEHAVAHELALLVVVGGAPQVGRVDAGVARAIAPAVVGLELVGDALDGPQLDGVKRLQRQRIDGALLPLEGRNAGRRPAGGNLHGAAGQRVAVVQVGGEVQPAFHLVDDADHVPGHAGRIGDLVVARLGLGDGAHARIGGLHPHPCRDLHRLPQRRIGLAQPAVGKIGHEFPLARSAANRN